MATAPELIAPPAPPQRPTGLFDVALGPMSFPRAEVGDFGFIYVPDDCEDDIFLYSIQCPAVSGSKTFSGIEAPVSGAPFSVITSYTCGAVGFSFEEAAQRVRTRMMLREQRAVERRLWQGQSGSNVLGQLPGLFRGATSLGTAGCVTEAVEMLEQALADNAVIGGIMHARPGMASHMANAHLLERRSPVSLMTPLGTPLVFGQGYDGTGPNGEATTTDDEYMYVSGRVIIFNSPDVVVPDPRQTFNTSTNQMFVLAERTYAMAVECGTWTVKVTRNCTTAA